MFTQLRTFVEVVATGSVRGAAQRLCVSQPAVSAALSSLQREVGVALVVRAGRGLDVTPARAGDELPATAALFLTHLATDDAVPTADRFHLGQWSLSGSGANVLCVVVTPDRHFPRRKDK